MAIIRDLFALIIIIVHAIPRDIRQTRETIKSRLPRPARTGRSRHDDRTTINGIMFVLVTGCRWSEMPKRYGSKSTAHRRLQNWQQKRIWQKILSDVIKSAHHSKKMQLQKISIDSSSISAKKGEM